ncbi:MAG: hypothetical protein PVF51_13145 [Nitrospirota bacterium]
MRSRWLFRSWLVLLLAAMPVFTACTGDDGDDGRDGVDGVDGVDATPTDLIPLGGLTADDVIASNLILDLNGSVAYDSQTGAVSVHFFLTDEDGNGADVFTDAYELRVYVSELMPSDAADDPGPNWHQLIAERGTPAAGSPMDGTLTLIDADTGEYNYVLANTLAATANVIRVTVRARWRTSERDKNGDRIVFANPVNASYDFVQSDPATRLDASGADMVTTTACETCHGARIGDVGHGGGYTQVKTCNHCHNLDYQDDDEADLAHMIHRIHVAGTFAEITDHDGNLVNFSELTYPQHIYTCTKCHTEDAPNADLAFTNPTRRNCGGCHSDVNFTKPGNTDPTPVNFADGTNHGGGAQADDSQCGLCHTEGGIGKGPIEAHDVTPAPEDVSEFQVTIDMTDPANGEYYVAGETPLVTVTLADADGNPVAGSVYTADADGEAAADVGEGLSTANLFVYGPRNEAVPVLTTNSTTDGGTQQGHSLLLTGGASADPQVMTDSQGYKYQLMDNIGDLEPGTYMVRFEGADYGAVAADDYVTSSSALINFQVGTAEVEPKVAGDACTNCHGATIMHLSGAHPHHAPFNTDHCLGCHDKSGNYAEYIGNRVHAVHRAAITGDLHNLHGDTHARNWEHVTFPRPANNCTTCHTNEVETPVWRQPYMAVCGGCHGVVPDTDLPEDPEFYVDEAGDPLDPVDDADRIAEILEQLRRENAAAQHMVQNGGDAVAEAGGATPTLQCLTCHGPGRVADLFNTHHLVQFRDLPEDPNE